MALYEIVNEETTEALEEGKVADKYKEARKAISDMILDKKADKYIKGPRMKNIANKAKEDRFYRQADRYAELDNRIAAKKKAKVETCKEFCYSVLEYLDSLDEECCGQGKCKKYYSSSVQKAVEDKDNRKMLVLGSKQKEQMKNEVEASKKTK